MHYRTLSRALSEGRDPDLCDRARMEEMRWTILGWAWNSGYVRYDREKGWRLNAPSKGSKGSRFEKDEPAPAGYKTGQSVAP